MKLFIQFLKDQLLFIVLYILSVLSLIGFYQMTVNGVEVIYPILLALFFFVIYLLVRFISYYQNAKSIEKLSINSCKLKAMSMEYQATYDAFNQVHKSYNNQIAELKRKSTEDKRLISAFVHNLKTPVTVNDLILQQQLTHIKQQEELGQLDESNQKNKKMYLELDAENKRLSSILTRLLDLQRLEEITNDYLPEPVLISEELAKIINANKSLFIHSRVYPKLEETSSYVYTDSKWNEVLINQLISNAVKYSKCDKPKNLYFTFETEGKYTNLILQDEGIGIPEYDLPKIFDAFFTGENGRAGYQSSGIGLYLCKQICDSLGHKIKIENHNGCRVTISYLTKL